MKWTFLVFLFANTLFSATPQENLDLRLRFTLSYSDSTYSCSTRRIGVDLILKEKVEAGELKSLIVANHPRTWANQWIYKELALAVKDHKVLKVDEKWWIEQLSNSEAFFKWALNIGLNRNFFCKLPKQVASASPDQKEAVFELEGVKDGIEVSYSDVVTFSGLREDKVPYKGAIRFIQRSADEDPELFPELNLWGK